MKYKNWLVEWLALYVKPTTKERTYKKYQRQIELHILPVLGEFELNDLTATVLQRFTVDLSEKGLSANTVNGIISVLKSSLRRAVLLCVTDKEFTMAIVRPKGREKQVDCFSKEEQRKIEQFIFEKKEKQIVRRGALSLHGLAYWRTSIPYVGRRGFTKRHYNRF